MVRELDLFENVAVIARKMPDSLFTEPDDDWAPIMFMEGPDGRATMPLSDFMTDESSKELLAGVLIPAAIKTFKPERVVMVISTWISDKSSKVYSDTQEYLPPSTMDDREERVLICEYTREGVTRQTWAEIKRSPDKVPQLGEWVELGAVTGVQGRFVDPIVGALKEVTSVNTEKGGT